MKKDAQEQFGGMEVHRKNTALAQDMVLVNMNGGNIAVNGKMVNVWKEHGQSSVHTHVQHDFWKVMY